jgi:hypothetical protein
MTNKSIATALTLGFLAFTLSLLPVTTAEARCQEMVNVCPEGWKLMGSRPSTINPGTNDVTCCLLTPSKPYATGETESERLQRFAKECEAQGKLWQAGRCIDRPVKAMGKKKGPTAPALVKADCDSKGYTYNAQTNTCKGMRKAKPQGASEQEEAQSKQAEEQSSSEHSSDYSEDDYKPKKHKKKKRHHD